MRPVSPDAPVPGGVLWAALAFFVLTGLALRMVGLDSQSLWFDEGVTLHFASLPDLRTVVYELATIGRGSERLQILNVVLTHLWVGIFGNSETALRAWPALLGTVSLAGAWFAGARIRGRQAALWAVAFTAWAGYAVYFSRELRPYALLVLVGFFQVGAFAMVMGVKVGRGEGTKMGRWALAVCSALALATSIFSAFFTAALFLAHGIFLRDVRSLFRAWWPTALLCAPIAIGLAYIVLFLSDGGVGNAIPDLRQNPLLNGVFGIYGVLVGLTYGASLDELRSGGFHAVIRYVGWYVPLVLSVAVLALAAARQAWARWNRPAMPDRAWAVLVLAGVLMFGFQMLLAVGVDFNLQPRHLVWMFPVVAAGFGWVVSQGGRAIRLAGVVFLLVNGLSSVFLHVDARHAKDDFRGAAQYLGEEAGNGLVVVSSGEWLYVYYGLEGVVPLGSWDGTDKRARFRAAVERGPVWLCLNRAYDTPWPDRAALERYLGPGLLVRRCEVFKNMNVYEIVGGNNPQ